MEFGILGCGIRNPSSDYNPKPSSTVKDWNAVTWNPESTAGIQNLRLSWIPLHGAKLLLNSKSQYKEVHCGQFCYGV